MEMGLRAAITGALMLGAFLPALASEATVDFVREVEPILKASCVECHGADKQKGDLRLDNREAAMRGGTNGASIVPHDHARSLLIKRVLGEGDDPRMPKKKDPLSEQQIALLARWIDQGANWPESATAAAKAKRWSYIAPRAIAVPAVKDKGWIRNPIDAFILERLEHEGLAPEGEADRATLLRRVFLDLTGLPPAPAQVDAFIADRAPDAYERRSTGCWPRPTTASAGRGPGSISRAMPTPRLREGQPAQPMAVPRLGDRRLQQRHALRRVHHRADSPATCSPMPTPDQQHRHRLPPQHHDQRGGRLDPEEIALERLVDRVGTTAKVWLGLDHAVRAVPQPQVRPLPAARILPAAGLLRQRRRAPAHPDRGARRGDRTRLQGEIAALKQAQAALASELGPEQAAWEKPGWARRRSGRRSEDRADQHRQWHRAQPPGRRFAPRQQARGQGHLYLTATAALPRMAAVRLEVLPDPSLPASGPGAASNGNFVLSGFAVEMRIPGGRQALRFTGARADFSQNDWPVAHALDGRPDTGWAIQPETGKAHAATFACVPLDLPAGSTLVVTLSQQSPYAQHLIGRLRLSASTRDDEGGRPPCPSRSRPSSPSPRRSAAPRRPASWRRTTRASARPWPRAAPGSRSSRPSSRPAPSAPPW